MVERITRPMLGKYELLKTLGSGAYSKVKLAYDRAEDKYYALKVHYPEHPGFTVQTIDVIANEILSLQALSHPNIIKIIEWIE